MEIQNLSIEGVQLITPQIFGDDRGFFLESYHAKRYGEAGLKTQFLQDNLSCSERGVLRGMHFQTEPGQAKLVTVLAGEIYDVIVDMRIHSKTFKHWIGVKLDSKERGQLFVPVGCAHGFCVVSESALVQYKVSAYYNAETEKGFRYDDVEIGIEWPVATPILSERDQSAPLFNEVVGLCI